MIERSTSGVPRAHALVALHAAVLLFGFSGLFGKWLALPPVAIVFGRTTIAWAALALLRRLASATNERGAFEWRLAAGGVVLALHWVAFFQAIQVASVAVGLLGCASFPLFVLLLEWGLRQRALRATEWLTAGLVTGGLVLIVPEFSLDNRIVQGLGWGVLAGLTFALIAVNNRALTRRHEAGAIALWQNGCAALVLLPFAANSGVPAVRDVGLLLVLGIACTALAHTLFIRSLRAVSAHTASVVAALEPVYGIALAFLLLGETSSARTLIGGALIIGAAFFATMRSFR